MAHRCLTTDDCCSTPSRPNPESDRWDKAQIIVQSIASGERRIVVRGGSAAPYLSTDRRCAAAAILCMRLAIRCSPRRSTSHASNCAALLCRSSSRSRVRLTPLCRAASRNTRCPQPACSPICRAGRAAPPCPRSLALAGRDGKIQTLGLPPQPYIHPRLSPDGRQLVVGTDDGKDANVWVYDLKAGGSLRRLTFGGRNQYPIWTRDGRFITFQSNRDGDDAIFRQPADGSGPAERLTKPEAGSAHRPESWSPDGKTLSMNVVNSGTQTQSVWTITTDPGAKPTAFADTPAVEKHSSFSPDGRWVAYMANTKATQTSTSSRFHRPAPSTRLRPAAERRRGRPTASSSSFTRSP